MTRIRTSLIAAVAACMIPAFAEAEDRWSAEKASTWYAAQAWPTGANFLPSTAINQLEMWQAATFDPDTIDRELGWAEGLGFNSMRVFLHDLPWAEDSAGFLKRIDMFLGIAAKHKIRPMFVLFDSCWDPNPKLGFQHAPTPGVHNSGWVQSPGKAILTDSSRWGGLEAYVKGVIGAYKDDPRILAWDLFNEPDNTNGSSYGKQEPPDKVARSLDLLAKSYAWARSARPTQPLTSAVWIGDWSPEKCSATAQIQLEESDVISFHDYAGPADLKARIAVLKKLGRPILCTEYMARPAGSKFDPNLGILREERIAAYNWGFVDGKSQTCYPWDSWKKPYPAEPPLWFHDIFRRDGTPYDAGEVAYIRSVTGKAAP